MELKEARKLVKKLKVGDIVLISEKGLKHMLNKLLQRSKWNHVMLYMGKGQTMEVTPRNGAHICDLMHDLTEKPYAAWKALRFKKLTDSQRKSITKTALKLFKGKKFAPVQYAKIILGRSLHWKMNGNRSMVCKPNHTCNIESVVCSNMVAIAYYEAGYPIIARYMPEYVIPKDYESSTELSKVTEGKANSSLA